MNHVPATRVDIPSPGGTDTLLAGTTARTDADPLTGTPAPVDVRLRRVGSSPAGWWTRYGGALDVRSGVVFIPPGADLPPCPFPCTRCRAKGKQ